jgi:hypothetical protein
MRQILRWTSATSRVAAGAFVLLWTFGLSVAALSGCATVNYDAEADKQLTTLSQEINLELITWANQIDSPTPKPAAYDAKFYDKVEADLTTLEIRMGSSQSEATDKVMGVVQSLLEQIEGLRRRHEQQKTLTDAEFLRAEQQLLNVQIACDAPRGPTGGDAADDKRSYPR